MKVVRGSTSASRRRTWGVGRVVGLGFAGVGLVAGAVLGLTRLDDLLTRSTDTAVAISPVEGHRTSPSPPSANPAAESPPDAGHSRGATATTEPVAPQIVAAHENGGLLELDGPFLHSGGLDPFAWRPDPRSCDGVDHAVVVDRAVQRGWLCESEQVTTVFPLTSSDLQPDPGVYEVYAKDIKAWSWEFGPPSTMTHFVAFTRGKFAGARIAFHSVPVYADGSWAQPLESVGTMEHFGDSSGCIRLLPEDAEVVWNFLELGGSVRVIS